MTVYRQYSGRELQLDLNLLICHFPQVLADALERCAHSPGLVTVVHPGAEMLTA
jgi:hypothetical protein